MDQRGSATKFADFAAAEVVRARERYAKLLPYFDAVKTLRDKGWTFKEIATKLAEYDMQVKPSYLSLAYREHFKIRSRRGVASAEKVRLKSIRPLPEPRVVESR